MRQAVTLACLALAAVATPQEPLGQPWKRHIIDNASRGADLDVITTEEVHNLGVIWYENPLRP